MGVVLGKIVVRPDPKKMCAGDTMPEDVHLEQVISSITDVRFVINTVMELIYVAKPMEGVAVGQDQVIVYTIMIMTMEGGQQVELQVGIPIKIIITIRQKITVTKEIKRITGTTTTIKRTSKFQPKAHMIMEPNIL